MGIILPQEVEMHVNGGAVNYYENIGYSIPRELDNQKRLRVIKNTKIKVHVLDLPKHSNIKIKVQCGICGKITDISYNNYNKNIDSNNGLYCCKDLRSHTRIKASEEFKLLRCSLENFLIDYKRFPKYDEYTNEYGFNYSYTTAESICKLNKTSLKDLYCDIDCFKALKPSVKYYDKYLDKLIELINTTDLGTNLYGLSRGDNCKKYSLPNIKWFIENCPNKNIVDIPSFKKWAGILDNYLTKEQCVEKIIKMSENFNRPLMYDDFRGCGYGHVSVNMINKYWGSLNKMKKELKLEIIQESMIDKQLSKEDVEHQVKTICNYLNEDSRDFITTREIDKLSQFSSSDTLRRSIKKYFNMSLGDYFYQFDIRIGNTGNGIVFDFKDGERTTSQFEYMFSKFLRNYGLDYNKDYFRDVKYSEFIPNYKGNMNCDYIIKHNNKTIYVEIAGIIEAYKTWYYEDKQIARSKSKEKYRLKLKQKEQMLKDNNLIYFILFPCDLTRDIFMQIINNGSLEVKHNIECFMKNNINWVKIQEIGELKYKTNETSSYGQLIVDYTERNVS